MTDRPEPRRVVVVDVANVMGSRPDGWWRDRAGAAARLVAALDNAVAARRLPYDTVVAVLEGRARAGAAERTGAVAVVHAPTDGDSEIARQAAAALAGGDEVTVVTADRGLVARLAEGVGVWGPRRLLDLL